MSQAITAISRASDSVAAGVELGQAIRRGLAGQAADAVVVFASSQHQHQPLLEALARESGTECIAGSSSAGEFIAGQRGEGHVSALGIRSDTMRFAVAHGLGVGGDPAAAAENLVAMFRGEQSDQHLPYRSALVMTDALAGDADSLVEALTLASGGNYRFFGGGAGDDGHFHQTHVFAGTRSLQDAAVALEIQSMQPVGIGVSHGWVPAGPGLRVTEVSGQRLVGLNGLPAIEAFRDHAAATGQQLDPSDPLPFFLHNVLGILNGDNYRLRVPLGLEPDGSISCAAPVPPGTIVHIMKTSADSAVQAAESATRAALAGLAGNRGSAALVFDCVATRLRLGRAFDDELRACAELLDPVTFVGCNTYGQIARAEGQFSGFHNCTAVVCVLPD